MEFRTLTADEIDVRIGSISAKGLSLLLYKDARVDMNILDETVGAMNWKKSYSRDNANCTVSIWDADKKEWISKEDTGTESNTEKEKGLASDSFKRACVNWGIGRELYTAPFIWFNASDCNITNDNGKAKCNDKFVVELIGYDNKRNITSLVVRNEKTEAIWKIGQTPGKKESPKEKEAPKKILVGKNHIVTIKSELERTGLSVDYFCEVMKVKSLEEMTIEDFKVAMEKFSKTKDKE